MIDYDKLISNLKKRHFDAYYFQNREDAVNKVMELIPMDKSVGWGGSMTIDALGIKEKLKERGNKLYDRSFGKTPEEVTNIMRQGFFSDYFLMSSNAVTMDGMLLNMDGRGNRVASLCFGPDNVIVVVGKNKIVENLDEAYHRVREYVAPKNAKRLNCNTPCNFTGKCSDCMSPNTICSQMVTTRVSFPSGKIKVIIIDEELGF